MLLETWTNDGCRTHLLVAERTREAVLVDPLLTRVEADLAALRERGLTLRWVIDTHTHADHLSAGSLLLKKSDAGYLMHDSTRVATVTRRVVDGEELGLGEATLRFLHVPGHTRDSLMIALPDALLTGDFLFLGTDGAGRLDLPGGDADAHYASLRKLDEYGAGAELRPAHDYQGRSLSTLKAERASNPVLSPRTRDEYLKFWSDRRAGPADWMGAVVAANAAGTIDPAAAAIPKDGYACAASTCATGPAAPVVPEWSPRELAARLRKESLTILDVREPEEYAGELGRIKGSRLLPLGELPSRLTEVPAGPVVTVCRSGKRSARAAAELLRAGRTQVRSMAGGMLAWNDAGLPVERA
jgi:glyoxylase-like metal-dependent hydrolase (beta-lactamase superfamily II)/rhodanese-related sulfurtransferase